MFLGDLGNLYTKIGTNVERLIMSVKINKVIKDFSTVIIIFIISFLSQSCTDSVISPENEPFSFKVKVVDNSNKPLSNMKIGVFFRFTDPFINKKLLKEVNTNYGVTVLKYSVNKLCKLTLIAYDLENNVSMEIINNNRHNAGNYEVQFITGDLFPGVYKCVLEAKDTLDNNTLFRDSTYAVLWHKDPVYNGIGFTDNDGIFETRKKLYFPSLYELPVLIRTLENGPEPVGTFGIEDSVTILVTDITSNLTSRYTRKLGKNLNTYELIFPGSENVGNLITKRIIVDDKTDKRNKFILSKSLKINSVGLNFFTASTVNYEAYLDWQTQWEINNTGFEIQRKSNYSEFTAIGFVSGHGTTNQTNTYSFVDNNLNNGDYMYRLKIIETNGSFEYSDTAEVSIILPTEFSLYQNFPNPFN